MQHLQLWQISIHFISSFLFASDCLGRRLGPRFLGRGGDDSVVMFSVPFATQVQDSWIGISFSLEDVILL